MKCFAYLSVGFVLFQLINVVLNYLFRQNISKNILSSSSRFVSVLIPARNEEQNIASLLRDLMKTENDNLEIIVLDDHSTDRTAEIVLEYASYDKRIQLLRSKELPSQWLGKNYACYQLAKHAQGEYFLFLDADVRISGDIIQDSLSYLDRYGLTLLSIFPIQRQESLGEKTTVPIMNYILLTLLPLIFVRTSCFSSHSAANGQFMLFDALTYKKHNPHKTFRSSPVEDIAIARYLKKKKEKIACVTGDSRIECRMYRSYSDALSGFSKNVFMFFGNNPILAFLFWILVAFGCIPIFIYTPELISIYCLIVVSIQILYSSVSKQNILSSILLFPIQLLFLLNTLCAALLIKQTKQYTWKGRNIY